MAEQLGLNWDLYNTLVVWGNALKGIKTNLLDATDVGSTCV